MKMQDLVLFAIYDYAGRKMFELAQKYMEYEQYMASNASDLDKEYYEKYNKIAPNAGDKIVKHANKRLKQTCSTDEIIEAINNVDEVKKAYEYYLLWKEVVDSYEKPNEEYK